MKRDERLHIVLHTLTHLCESGATPTTSEALAAHFSTNPVVVRRALAGMRLAGIVTSSKGHGGGWTLARSADGISLREIYAALGKQMSLAPQHEAGPRRCLIEQSVGDALAMSYAEAESLLLSRLDALSLADIAIDYRKRLAGHPSDWREPDG